MRSGALKKPDDLLRMGDLSRRSKVPIATLKFYVREGLLAPVRKSGQTMAWYAPSAVARIGAIRELQERHFLPLDVIRKTLDRGGAADDDLAAAEAIAGVLAKHTGPRSRSRAELIERGVNAHELDWLARSGLAVPDRTDRYRDDDLALLSTLGAARKVGIAADMLPFDILGDYLSALNQLVTVELRLFRIGVIKRAPRDKLRSLTTAATELSERLVVLLRRKLLLPTLKRLIEEEARESNPEPGLVRHRVRRKQPSAGVARSRRRRTD